MIYNASKVRIKEIQNINDRLINNQGNHPQRRNVSVFALWRSVSPVCCLSQIKPIETKTSLISTQANPGDTGTLQKTNVRPLIDCLLGWRGPKNSLDRRPFQQGKRILFGWKKHPHRYVFCLLSASFFTFLLEGLRRRPLGDIHSQPEQLYMNPKCSKWNAGSPTKLHHHTPHERISMFLIS